MSIPLIKHIDDLASPDARRIACEREIHLAITLPLYLAAETEWSKECVRLTEHKAYAPICIEISDRTIDLVGKQLTLLATGAIINYELTERVAFAITEQTTSGLLIIKPQDEFSTFFYSEGVVTRRAPPNFCREQAVGLETALNVGNEHYLRVLERNC